MLSSNGHELIIFEAELWDHRDALILLSTLKYV